MASVAQSRAKLSKESTYSVQRASAPSFQLHLFFFSSLPPFPLLTLSHPRSLTLPLDLLRSTIPRYVPAIPVLFLFHRFFSHFSLRLQSTRVSLHSYIQPVTADKPIGPIDRFFIAVRNERRWDNDEHEYQVIKIIFFFFQNQAGTV